VPRWFFRAHARRARAHRAGTQCGAGHPAHVASQEGAHPERLADFPLLPAREVGGDFYDFFELKDGRVGFAVGDATGKGVPAAFVMSATCALLGGVATALSSSPGEVLSRVNEAVLTRIPPNMFITCFCAILDPKSSALSYANAGHDLPYVRVIARDLPPWEADRETSEARRSAPRVRENLR
jgi:hypothetical protein